jgi:hypothetical protein
VFGTFFISAGNLCEFLVKTFLLFSFNCWLQNKAKFVASKVPNEKVFLHLFGAVSFIDTLSLMNKSTQKIKKLGPEAFCYFATSGAMLYAA